MRPIAITLLLLSATLFAQPTDEAAVIAVVQESL
jgi:hypothetical protein